MRLMLLDRALTLAAPKDTSRSSSTRPLNKGRFAQSAPYFSGETCVLRKTHLIPYSVVEMDSPARESALVHQLELEEDAVG